MLVRFHRVVPRCACCGGVSPSLVHSRMIPLIDPPPSNAAHASATAGPSTGWAVTWSSRYPNGRGVPRNRLPLIAACSLASFCRSALQIGRAHV